MEHYEHDQRLGTGAGGADRRLPGCPPQGRMARGPSRGGQARECGDARPETSLFETLVTP